MNVDPSNAFYVRFSSSTEPMSPEEWSKFRQDLCQLLEFYGFDQDPVETWQWAGKVWVDDARGGAL